MFCCKCTILLSIHAIVIFPTLFKYDAKRLHVWLLPMYFQQCFVNCIFVYVVTHVCSNISFNELRWHAYTCITSVLI